MDLIDYEYTLYNNDENNNRHKIKKEYFEENRTK